MSGDRYVIQDQHYVHFLTFTVVEWLDVFTRPEYKYVITDSLNYCIGNRGMKCYAWVLMSNHLHLIVETQAPYRLSDVIRDFKKHTSKALVELIHEVAESRREWLLHKFRHWARSTQRAEQYKLWQDGYHGVCLEGDGKRMKERIDYIHNNPVRQLVVAEAEHYLFSSAGDYSGKKGLVEVVVAL